MSFELHNSFKAPEKLLDDQLERQDSIRQAAFLFVRSIQSGTRDQADGSREYRDEAIRLARSSMLAALEAVSVEKTLVPRRDAGKKVRIEGR